MYHFEPFIQLFYSKLRRCACANKNRIIPISKRLKLRNSSYYHLIVEYSSVYTAVYRQKTIEIFYLNLRSHSLCNMWIFITWYLLIGIGFNSRHRWPLSIQSCMFIDLLITCSAVRSFLLYALCNSMFLK